MKNHEVIATNFPDFEQVDCGLVISLKTLRETLKHLSVRGRRWWIAMDPRDAVESRQMKVGYGDPNCNDLLNAIYFRLPVLNESLPRAGADRIIILFDASCCVADQPGFYIAGDGRIEQDFLEDFASFFYPLKQALLKRMQIDS